MRLDYLNTIRKVALVLGQSGAYLIIFQLVVYIIVVFNLYLRYCWLMIKMMWKCCDVDCHDVKV